MYFFVWQRNELRHFRAKRMKVRPRTVIYKHKKLVDLNFLKLSSLELRFLWKTDTN